MADETNPPMAQLLDFSNAMCAGCGFTRLNDERGRKFDENLRSGEFAKSGLQQVAETLMENIRRLCSHAKMPYQIFNYGRRFHDVYLRFYAEPAVNKSEIMSDDEFRHFQSAKRTWNCSLCQEPHD